jgi:uncharacterized protein YbjQ (UPF0145 family)
MSLFKPVPVLTTKLIGQKNVLPLGTVVGNDRERISLVRNVGESFMTLFGWSSGLMRKKMDDLVENAKQDLQKNVLAQYPEATAVYDADFNFSTSTWHLDLTITGTAVIEKNELNSNNSNKSKSRRNGNARRNRTRRS